MSKRKNLLFLTGKTAPDVMLECTQMEAGEPRPPAQCYLCKRQQGEQSAAIKVAPGSTEPLPTFVELKVEYVRANSIPDADIFFPLCQDCRLLLDLWGGEN
jgi:hypothetical protein